MVYVYLSIITIEYLFYFQTMFGRYCFECAPRSNDSLYRSSSFT